MMTHWADFWRLSREGAEGKALIQQVLSASPGTTVWLKGRTVRVTLGRDEIPEASVSVTMMPPHGPFIAFTGWVMKGKTPAPVPAQVSASAQILRFPLPPTQPKSVRGVWPGTYAQYTATREWHQIAAAARKEWGYCCMICNRSTYVEVHHRTYRGVPFGEDLRWDLVLLCEDCHRLYHHRLTRPPVGLFDVEEVKKAA